MNARTLLPALALLCASLASLPLAQAEVTRARAAAAPQPAQARLIVTYKPGAGIVRAHAMAAGSTQASAAAMAQGRASTLAAHAGVALTAGGVISAHSHVVMADGVDTATLMARLRSHPDVQSVSVDGRRRALAVPTDPLFSVGPAVNLVNRTGGPVVGQWYLRAPAGEVMSSVNATAAWDRVVGSASVVVAVLDTGVVSSHLDLAGVLLPGYDMINDAGTANDGDGRDADASDPGDWITAAENASGPFKDCGVSDSIWHGTQVASVVAASANNGQGMAGTAFGVRILPVRVLGKCGGFDSDIQAGLRWAAGLDVPGIARNPNPARVINLSLGSDGAACTQAYRDVIAEVNLAGAALVVAAGNTAGHAVGMPANCLGAIGVVGLRHVGSKVGFSDLGAEISIAAPGGNCINIGAGQPCLYPIITALNSGKTVPVAGGSTWSDSFNFAVGTSFSAPIVAGVLALMVSAQPQLTPTEMLFDLKASARAFPTTGAGLDENNLPIVACRAPNGIDQLQCYCTTALCGAGMADADAAVALAQGPHARIDFLPAAPTVGTALSLTSGATLLGAGRIASAYLWELVSGAGVAGAFNATNAASATLTPLAVGSFTVRLTVTDDRGQRSSVQRAVSVAAVPVVPPPSSGGGGGGGLASGWALLGLGVAVAALAAARRTRSTHPRGG